MTLEEYGILLVSKPSDTAMMVGMVWAAAFLTRFGLTVIPRSMDAGGVIHAIFLFARCGIGLVAVMPAAMLFAISISVILSPVGPRDMLDGAVMLGIMLFINGFWLIDHINKRFEGGKP